MKKARKKLLCILLAISFILSANASIYAAEATQSEVTELNGILIDKDCSDTTAPEKHTKSCNLMESCKESGYGLDLRQPDGSVKFVKFDANGDKLAYEYLIKSTTPENNISVFAKGTYSGEIFNVTELYADTTVEYKGIIIDADSSKNSTPEAITVKNILSHSANGFGVKIKQKNGTYIFYKFDEAGNKIAESILKQTKKEKNITVLAKGNFEGNILKTKIITEDLTVPEIEKYSGWLATEKLSAKHIKDPDNGTLNELSKSEGSYGVILTEDNGSFKFYKFDQNGQKLIKNSFLKSIKNKTNLTVHVAGWKQTGTFSLSSIEEEQIYEGLILTDKLFKESNGKAKQVQAFKRDQIIEQKSADSGYGVAVKQKNGDYNFYKLDEAGNKSAKSLVNWYVNWGENQSSIPVLVRGVLGSGNAFKSSNVYRERQIAGIISSVKLAKEDKILLKDIKRSDLLTKESKASGYGYYVLSCGGHEFYKFDAKGNEIVYNYLKKAKDDNAIKAIPYGYWYLVGNTIKVNKIVGNPAPDAPAIEEIDGFLGTRNYFFGSYYQENGVPGQGALNKSYLLNSKNAASGYGIFYRTCCSWGFLKFDVSSLSIVKNLISTVGNKTDNIKVIIKGVRVDDLFVVTDIALQEDKELEGILVDTASINVSDPQSITIDYLKKAKANGYGILVKQAGGTYKFFKFDNFGGHYRDSGNVQASDLLQKTKKADTDQNYSVKVNGTIEADGTTIHVSNISEADAEK